MKDKKRNSNTTNSKIQCVALLKSPKIN
uniref:Uncharacterized protein n=1 Tax=Rhizophora mucronata TaxID=61149 RepID=A0A2P2J001_RHIMU